MANASPVHPLRSISAPRCSTLILFSTMKDNENRVQQQRTLYLCPTLSHCFCITRWCSPLIPPSGYLYPFLSLPHKHIWSGEECRLLNYSKSWQKVSLSVNSNESRFRSVYLWMEREQKPQLWSFPACPHAANETMWAVLLARTNWGGLRSFFGRGSSFFHAFLFKVSLFGVNLSFTLQKQLDHLSWIQPYSSH